MIDGNEIKMALDTGYKNGYGDGQVDAHKELHSLRSQLNEAREIIAFYGDPVSWKADGHPQMDADTAPIKKDGGARARSFLSKTEGNDG